MTNIRDNDSWLRDLRAGSAERDAVLADLRAHLAKKLLSIIQRFQARGESTTVAGSVAETRTSNASIITPR